MSAASKQQLTTPSRTNNGLVMILSPAKTLNLKNSNKNLRTTEPSCHVEKTNELASILKKKSKGDLKTLLKISDNLATSVSMYYQNFEIDSSKRNQDERIPASYAFDGPAYKGVDVKTCTPQTLDYLQSNLIIIDPLYGCLRALDMIQPYRLEMSTKAILKDLSNFGLEEEEQQQHKSLASWWSESVTDTISKLLNEKENDQSKFLINLASDEYAAAVNFNFLPTNTKFVKVVFQQEGRVIAVHAKRARGLMVRYISENQIIDLDKMKEFDVDGYSFIEERSDDTTLTFDRPKAEKKSNNVKRKAVGSSSDAASPKGKRTINKTPPGRKR